MRIYDNLFWRYLVERESVRLRRLAGLPRDAWTDDQVLRRYRFTNVKRRHDRITSLLSSEFYDQVDAEHPSPVALLNATLFRYHGTVETARAIGWHDDWTRRTGDRMEETNRRRRDAGEKIFTGAYVIPAGGATDDKTRIVRIVADQVWERADEILDTDSWREACEFMTRRLWNVGQFMAKEVLLDYMIVTGWRPTDWQTWTPVGPGARRGAAVVLDHDSRMVSPTITLETCRELYDRRLKRWAHDVSLDLTDVQFGLCEFAKYEGALRGIRPKRLFSPTIDETTRGIR